MTFRAKPFEVEAMHVVDVLSKVRDNWFALPPWLRYAYEGGSLLFGYDTIHSTDSRVGGHARIAKLDDWIVWVEETGAMAFLTTSEFRAQFEPVEKKPEK